MTARGDVLMISATINQLETGQVLAVGPTHMTIIRPFYMQADRRHYVVNAMSRLFADSVYSDAVMGDWAMAGTIRRPSVFRRVEGIPMVTIRDHELTKDRKVNPEWFALHALVKSLGSFNEGDPFQDTFAPHISNNKDHSIKMGDPMNFQSAVLFASAGEGQGNRVLASFPHVDVEAANG